MEIKEVAIESVHCKSGWGLKLREDLMQVYKLADSIREWGQMMPVICWEREGEWELVSGATILAAMKILGKKTVYIYVSGAKNEQEALKIWAVLNLNYRPINYIEFAKKIKQYPEIKRALANQTILLKEEIESLEKLLDFDWGCFEKAKEQAEGPDMFGGLFDGN